MEPLYAMNEEMTKNIATLLYCKNIPFINNVAPKICKSGIIVTASFIEKNGKYYKLALSLFTF